MVGFSYHLPSKSYAIFQLPTSSITTHHSTFPLQHPIKINSIKISNTPLFTSKRPINQNPEIIDGNSVVETETFLSENIPSSIPILTDDVDELNLQNTIDAPLDSRIPQPPQTGHDPYLLNLPPLMSPEILHGTRIFPEIELQKVPSLGETNTMAIGPPMETTLKEDDKDLKFFDAVPELEKLSKLNGTDNDTENIKNKKRVRLRRRRRRKNYESPTKLQLSSNHKNKSKCQNKAEIRRLNSSFPKCTKQLNGLCMAFKSRNKKDSRLKTFGDCLIKKYPKTRRLSKLSPKMLKSGRGTIQFQSDEECTDFVHTFFSKCKKYISTCKNVREGDRSQAKLVLGCLFSNYSRLLIPLMSVTKT